MERVKRIVRKDYILLPAAHFVRGSEYKWHQLVAERQSQTRLAHDVLTEPAFNAQKRFATKT